MTNRRRVAGWLVVWLRGAAAFVASAAGAVANEPERATLPIPAPPAIAEVALASGGAQTFSLELAAGDYFQLWVAPAAPAVIDLEIDRVGVADEPVQGAIAGEIVCGIAPAAGRLVLTVLRTDPGASGPLGVQVQRDLDVRPARPGDPDACAGQRAFWRAKGILDRGDLAAALAGFAVARDRFHAAGDAKWEVDALLRIGWIHKDLGRLDTAIATYREALPLVDALAPRAGSELEVARTSGRLLNNLGEALRARGDAPSARAALERAVALADRWPQLGRVFGWLATNTLAGLLEDVDPARARALFDAIASHGPAADFEAASAEVGLARLDRQAGALATALERVARARALAPTSDRIAWSAAFEECAIHLRRGAFDAALLACGAARAVAVAQEDDRQSREWLAATGNQLGTIDSDLGAYDAALEEFERARRAYADLGLADREAEALRNQGLAELALGRFRDAEASFRTVGAAAARAGDAALEADARLGLGRAELLRPRDGSPAVARELLTEALALAVRTGSREVEADVRLELATALARLGRGDEALSLLDGDGGALALADGLGDTFRRASALARRAEILLDRGDLDAALAAASEAVRLNERLRDEVSSGDLRASFFARRRRAYELEVEILAALARARPGRGYEVRAFESSEAARARGLLDLLAERRLAAADAGGAARPEVEGALSAAEIQASLPADALLLEYLLGERAAFLFTATREEVRVVALGPADKINFRARALAGELRKPSAGRGALALAASVAADLLAPAGAGLATRRTLLVVPDGDLFSIPFEVLPPPGGEIGATLLLSTTVSYAPSASVLARLDARQVADRGLDYFGVGVADPGDGSPRLEQAEGEVRSIGATFGTVATLVGPAATESALAGARGELGCARHLHFATHGDFAPDLQRTGLKLAKEPGGDGILQVFEVLGLHLEADLAVLSACETARGRRIAGEGVLGLPRAFFYAGARTVAVSLWRVDDHATRALMTSFYNYLREGLPKAEALRQAKLELIRGDRASPWFWGPFILIGSVR